VLSAVVRCFSWKFTASGLSFSAEILGFRPIVRRNNSEGLLLLFAVSRCLKGIAVGNRLSALSMNSTFLRQYQTKEQLSICNVLFIEQSPLVCVALELRRCFAEEIASGWRDRRLLFRIRVSVGARRARGSPRIEIRGPQRLIGGQEYST
jgi:hypothetical protein